MKSSSFNTLPTFYQALENPDFNEKTILSAGKVLIRLGLENKYGIFLLHRHFDMFEDEVLAKYINDGLLISTPIHSETPNLTPSSWCLDVINAIDTVKIFEYTVSAADVDTSDVKPVLEIFGRLGLGHIFGIFRRDLIPESDDLLFEISDDVLRISLVSPWQDDTHVDGWYKQSTFTFCKSKNRHGIQLTNAGVACTDTSTCYGCAASSEMLRFAMEQTEQQNKGINISTSNAEWVLPFVANLRAINRHKMVSP